MEYLTITLLDLHFFSKHGLFKEEQKIGGEFIVDLSLTYEAKNAIIHSLDETINYAAVFEVVKSEMEEPKALLETFVMHLSAKLKEQFSTIKKLDITITKVHPPIVQYTGSVSVRFQKDF